MGIYIALIYYTGFPDSSAVKNLPANAGESGPVSGEGRFLWKKMREPTPGFFPGKFHGQSNLAGHSPRGRKESGMAKHTHTIYHTVSENSNLSSVETEYHQDQLNLL